MTGDYIRSLVSELKVALKLRDTQVIDYLTPSEGYMCLKIDLDRFSPTVPLQAYSYIPFAGAPEVWHFHLEPGPTHRRDDLRDLLTYLKPEIRDQIKPLLFCMKLEGEL